jgi:hypothetical protein|tara:strand:- start:6693 stop:6902 length:210 start_codon:yes stop_codon:yes gene_type:complete
MDRRLARIIKLVKEEMVGNAVGQSGGFGSNADAKGPVAGYDKGLGKKKKDKKPLKRYLYGGAGSRKRWM